MHARTTLLTLALGVSGDTAWGQCPGTRLAQELAGSPAVAEREHSAWGGARPRLPGQGR